jgi:uncharacterized membrane protein
MNLAKAVLFLLSGIFIGQIWYYYPNLPDVVASHFDSAGKADGFMTKQNFVIFEIAFLILIVGEALLLPRLIEKIPDSLLNLPNKSYWLAAERRSETFRNIRNYFEWFSVLLLAFFITINQSVFRANIARENLSPIIIWIILSVFLALVIIWLIKFVRQFRIKS